MKTTNRKIFITFIITSFYCANLSAQKLNDNLKILSPLIGKTWTGMLMAPDSSQGFKIVRTYEPIWNGEVVKCSKTNLDMNKNAEGYFYWDDMEKKLAFFFIEEGGVFLKGYVTSEANIITIEGTMTWPKQMNPNVKQQYEFKNSFEFTPDGNMTDKWFMNAFGPWRPGHTILFSSN